MKNIGTFCAVIVGALTVGVISHASDNDPNKLAGSQVALLAQPVRVLDTRDSDGPVSDVHVTLNDRPFWATAVVANITVTDTVSNGYAVAYDCQTLPDTSNVNWSSGDTVANLVLAPISPTYVTDPHEQTPGELCVHLNSPASVVIDLVGWASAASYWQVP